MCTDPLYVLSLLLQLVVIMADSSQILRVLLPITIDGVSALQIYMAYLEKCTAKDVDTRTSRYIKFVKWMQDTGEHFDYALLSKYENYLLRVGNALSTIKVKLSNIRQFLLEAEKSGLLSSCIFYAKRGRPSKQSFVPILLQPNKEIKPKTSRGRRKKEQRVAEISEIRQVSATTSRRGRNGFKKTFLYDMFQIHNGVFSVELLKRSFRKLATAFHPDHTNGSQEQFLACKEAYDYLMDTINRNTYDVYTQNNQSFNTDNVSSFVHSVYRRIGGYSALSL